MSSKISTFRTQSSRFQFSASASRVQSGGGLGGPDIREVTASVRLTPEGRVCLRLSLREDLVKKLKWEASKTLLDMEYDTVSQGLLLYPVAPGGVGRQLCNVSASVNCSRKTVGFTMPKSFTRWTKVISSMAATDLEIEESVLYVKLPF